MGHAIKNLRIQEAQYFLLSSMGFDRNLNRWSEKSLEEAAAEEFGESPAILTSSLLSVKTWISQCPHLKQACTEDLFLTTFLRGCKFSLERTKEKLDNFHAIKTSLPEWFDNWDPKDPAVQEILSAGIFLPLPGFDREGRLVTLSRSGKVVPSKMKLDDLIRTSLMVMAVARAGEQQSVIRGLVQVQDMEGLGAHHLSLFNIPTIKKLIKMGESAWPLRPKMAHILNRPSLVDTVADLVKGLQKEKMQRRQVVHPQGDYSGLVEDLGKGLFFNPFNSLLFLEFDQHQISFLWSTVGPTAVWKIWLSSGRRRLRPLQSGSRPRQSTSRRRIGDVELQSCTLISLGLRGPFANLILIESLYVWTT